MGMSPLLNPKLLTVLIATATYYCCCGFVAEVLAFRSVSNVALSTNKLSNFRRSLALFQLSSSNNNEFDFILQEGQPTTTYDKQQQQLYHDPRVTRRQPPIVVLPDTSKVFEVSVSTTVRSGRYARDKKNWFNYDPDKEDEDDDDDDYEDEDIISNANGEANQETNNAVEEKKEKEETVEEEATATSTAVLDDQPQQQPVTRTASTIPAAQQRIQRSAPVTRRSKGMPSISYPSVNSLLENGDYLGAIWKWGIPVTAGAIGIASSAKYMTDTYQKKGIKMCEDYGNEMLYHDGDFEEMKLCHRDWKRKMRFLFPIPSVRKTKMLSSYLETFTKKKPVSPQAVSSLSFILTMYKLTEQQAARILTQVAKKQLGVDKKPASAGKLLFFGTRILKTPEAQADLLPIREMLQSSYKVGGEMFVTNSQKTMGEAAYKTAVAAAGKDAATAASNKLIPGWEILGLDKETAQRLYDEVKNDGFVTGVQKLYGEKFFEEKAKQKKAEDDKKKESGDVKGVVNDEEDDEDNLPPAGMVFECSECGYTMFPAKGREFKFLPADFKCPECGAAKDKFVDLSQMD